MRPEIHVLGLSLKTFGICFALGFLVAGAISARRLGELGRPPDEAYGMVGSSLVGGIVGARAYYLIQHWGSVKHDVIGSIFSGSGLVWYGGGIGGAIAVLLWAWRHDFLERRMFDTAVYGLAFGYAIGRIGCQVSGDGDYGKVSNLPWAMGYPHGTVPTPAGVHVQPTPIYETLAMGLLAWLLWRIRDRVRPGVVFALYLVGAGVERLLVEFVRRNDHVLGVLTGPQLGSLAVMFLGVVALAWLARQGPLRSVSPT